MTINFVHSAFHYSGNSFCKIIGWKVQVRREGLSQHPGAQHRQVGKASSGRKCEVIFHGGFF